MKQSSDDKTRNSCRVRVSHRSARTVTAIVTIPLKKRYNLAKISTSQSRISPHQDASLNLKNGDGALLHLLVLNLPWNIRKNISQFLMIDQPKASITEM